MYAWHSRLSTRIFRRRLEEVYHDSGVRALLDSDQWTASCGGGSGVIAPAKKTESIDPLLLTPRDAAQLLSISERSLARLAAAGEILPVRLGGGRIVRYPRSVLEDFVRRQTASLLPS